MARPDPRRQPIFDPQLALMIALLALLAGLAWWRGGVGLVWVGLGDGWQMLLRYAAIIAVSFLAAGLARSLVPHEWIRGALGHEAGLRGILVATAAGVVTPAGPFVSMPIAAVLLRGGASPGAVVAFLTAWSLLALHRLVAWEVPILGLRFALLRYGISTLLPILAGLGTRALLRGAGF
jgi:Predicted permeases